MKKIIALIIWLCIAVSLPHAQETSTQFTKLSGPYLGQKPPGRIAEPFAQDIIATQHNFHGSVVFTPDGNEAYWSVLDKMRIMYSKRVNGAWTEPAQLFPNSDVPFISPDGNKLFFLAQKLDKGLRTEAVSVMDKTLTGWSSAYPLPGIINTFPSIHWQVSVDKKGNIFFGGKQNGSKSSKVYSAEFVNERYQEPKIIEELKDVESFSPFISPDGSYLIVTAFRGDLALYILFRKADGTWTKGIDISESIGARGEMLCPIVTHDGKYLFFLKGVGERTIPYWVDASFIEELRKTELAK